MPNPATGTRYFDPLQNVSLGDGYKFNSHPSVSAVDDYWALISWACGRWEDPVKLTGGFDPVYVSKTIVRPYIGISGGSFFIVDGDVNYTNNRTAGDGSGIIAWSKEDGIKTRWMKRTSAGEYQRTHQFSSSGIYTHLSGGTNPSTVKAVIFDISGSLPFTIYKPDVNFNNLEKLTLQGATVACTGVISFAEMQFVFDIGDIRLNDENIKFIARSDTLPLLCVEELNEAMRTEDFTLNGNSNLLFSVYYYVLNSENADSLLIEEDYVNFRV